MSENTKWYRDVDRVSLRLESGELLPVTAMEVFQAAFGAASTFHGVKLKRPSEDIPGLRFSRFPAEPAVRLRSSHAALSVEVGVKVGGDFLTFPGKSDQLIYKDEWFPVQLDALAELSEWLSGVQGFSNGHGTLATLIALRTKTDLPGRLVDEVRDSPLTLAASLAPLRQIEGLRGELYPYQVDGVGFLRMIADQGVGCVLADEMGLGKTLQIIALLLIEKSKGRNSSLVVAPATLLENWRRELALFAPDLHVHIHAGADRPGVSAKLSVADVTVVSYETAMRDEALLSAVSWNVVALDEAQNIKNPEAQRTLAVKRFPRRVSIAVTGTPLENRLDDLWSLSDFALPGLLGELHSFKNEYAAHVEDAARLGALMAPIVLRRRVLEVANDLPEKIETPQPLRMSRRLAEEYERLRQEILAEYGPTGNLVAMTKLRMLCAHPSIVSPWHEDPAADMPKFARLLEILEEIFSAGEKALVFSTYTGIADLLVTQLTARFPKGFFRHIDGRTYVDHRQPTVDEFFATGSYGALILNPKAAGTGLNITAASHVVHYNPEWNPALTDQATARAYRRKQTRPVTVQHLYFVDTVEEVIVERAGFKRQLAGEAVTGHSGDVEPNAIARALQVSPLAGIQEQ